MNNEIACFVFAVVAGIAVAAAYIIGYVRGSSDAFKHAAKEVRKIYE